MAIGFFLRHIPKKMYRRLEKRHMVGHVYRRKLRSNASKVKAAWKDQEPATSIGEDHLVLIVGAARTGTTLMQGLLCSDPSTNPLISESVFFRQFIEFHRATRIYTEKFPGHYFVDDTDLSEFMRVCIDNYLDHIKGIHQCTKLILKHPALTREITKLLDIYPDAKVICIVRDPRAIVASAMRWKIKLLAENPKHPFKSYKLGRFINFANSFYADLFAGFSDYHARRILFLRYEDVISFPTQTIEILEKFTGLDLSSYSPNQEWSSNLFDYSDENTPVSASVTPLYGKGISNSRLKAYEKQLTPKQIARIEKGCRELMDIFDYR